MSKKLLYIMVLGVVVFDQIINLQTAMAMDSLDRDLPKVKPSLKPLADFKNLDSLLSDDEFKSKLNTDKLSPEEFRENLIKIDKKQNKSKAILDNVGELISLDELKISSQEILKKVNSDLEEFKRKPMCKVWLDRKLPPSSFDAALVKRIYEVKRINNKSSENDGRTWQEHLKELPAEVQEEQARKCYCGGCKYGEAQPRFSLTERESRFSLLGEEELFLLANFKHWGKTRSFLFDLDNALLLLTGKPLKNERTLSPRTPRSNEIVLSPSSNEQKVKFINSQDESLEASESESMQLTRYAKNEKNQENSETESNQDTNGTTGPKKQVLKSEANIGPSSILTHSNSSHSQESINDSAIISDIQNPTFLPKSLFKSLLHNHGGLNVGTTSEKDSISLEASNSKMELIGLPRSYNSVALQKVDEYPHIKSKSEEGHLEKQRKLKNRGTNLESDHEENFSAGN